jgi:uncharacterized membrane protein
MTDSTLSSPAARPAIAPTAAIGGWPIHLMLVPFPMACFVGTLITDITYWRSSDIMWANFSAWLVTVGVILGVLAAIAGLFDFFGNRLVRRQAPAWPHVLGNLVALAIAILNMLVHTHDGWTSVVPWGLALSALVVVIMLFTGWMGWSLVHDYRVGDDGAGDNRIGVAR